MKITTTAEFYSELQKNIPFIDNTKKVNDEKIILFDAQIIMLFECFLSMSKRLEPKIVKDLVVDVLRNPNAENGKVYETLVYSWLEKRGVNFTPQHYIAQEECFKASSNGYYADGILKENNIIFDVKQFGLTLPHIETLRRKLQSYIPKEYYLTISGGRNVSSRDLRTHFLEKAKDIAHCIISESNSNYTDYIYHEKKYGLEFRAWNIKEHPVFTSISEFDPYEWAENNEYYFMYHSSQFCINSPYILFCPFDKQLAPVFSSKDDEFVFLTFRALCRRIFMSLLKMENRPISDFDGKARKNVSVASAAKKISAIVFIDVSDDFDYQHCRTFVFQNPNADHKIPRYQIDTLFRYAGAKIDDFRFDNY